MNLVQQLFDLKESFAGGWLEGLDREPVYRFSNAYRRFWEQAELTPYDGGMLYPCGKNMRCNPENEHMAIRPDYSYTYSANWELLREKSEEACAILQTEHEKVTGFDGSPHWVGGAGYTHCFINYKRILDEGLKGYRSRVKALPAGDFRDGLLILMEGMETYRQRCLILLREAGAKEELIKALEYVPENPPRNIYEALVAWNFVYYVDGCDDIGPLDRHLIKYYKGEDLLPLIRELFSHVDANDGWSGPLGPDYNEVTLACLRAIQNGRRPNLQLLIKPDMPEEVWEAAAEAIATSCGQPALHNYELYHDTLRELMPEIPEEDLARISFGGCTETMLEGISAVGSDDAGINVALIFAEWLHKGLAESADFETFKAGFVREMRIAVADTLDLLNNHRRTRALYRSQPIHTLFVDDCIKKQLDFNNNGPRWIWSVINIAGMINVIDSMNVVRELVYEKKRYTPQEFLEKLDAQEADFLQEAGKCPCYGVDDDKADLLGAELTNAVIDALDQRPCYPRGRFYPVSNQFTTYVGAGLGVGATPDGRADNAPLCDSLGAIHGHDTKGPTALLNSVAKLPMNRIIGTPVVNFRINKAHISMLKPLVQSYFQRGGMQLQVSCLSREEMLDAMAHPENHKNLVVRIGGYSEYFVRLSPELQQTVLQRTEY